LKWDDKKGIVEVDEDIAILEEELREHMQ